jgi:serine phosphatase RsbU (regulator of sigma subunit)/tetratricopeptide (TPR) repeat protein
MKRLPSLLLLLIPIATFGQVDSLLQRAISLEYSQPDSAIAITNDLISRGGLDQRTLSNAWEVQGIALWVKEEYTQAIAAHTESLRIRKEIDYKSGIGHSCNNLGLNFQRFGDGKLAMEYFLQAKDVSLAANDSSLLAKVLGNIGTLYEEENDVSKALAFYGQSLAILEKLKEDRILGNTLNNIALVYQRTNQLEKAQNFAKRSLAVRNLIDDKWGIAQSLNLLGVIASDKANYQEAKTHFNSALEYYNELNNQWGRSMVYGNLGRDANVMGNFQKGLEYCGISLVIAKENWLEWEESACECLAESYAGLDNIQKASFYWKRLIAIKDSIQQENMLAEISMVEKRIEFEKARLQLENEKLQAELEFEKERLEAQAEIEHQRTMRQAALGLGMMGLLLFFVAFRSYRTKQRDNDLLEEKNEEITSQKEVIEEKNKHITDSIQYAQNLQSAILPKEEMFKKHFTDHYILYKPKDIVSGDFYWMEEANGLVFLAVADCTGHGVPGAMVSMVGFQGLNKAVLEEGLTSPAEILQRLSDHVEEAFEKSGGTVKDGMDICLIAIDKKREKITYAGAHNALWILSEKEELPNALVREDQDGYRMFELKADRRSIGGYFDAGPFTHKAFDLNSGDRLFLFSDGYADQFGGPRGKKMGSKRMRETVRQMALSDNTLALGAILQDWQCDEEQIDDVTLISVVI